MCKKLCALLLTMVMLLQAGICVFAADDFTEDVVYEGAVLKGLGIIGRDYSADEVITRAEFAKAIAGFINAKDGASISKTAFSDIDSSDAKEEINTVYINGIMNGVGNNMFAPDAPILYSQALTVLVRALGYGQLSESEGVVADVKRKIAQNTEATSAELFGDDFITLVYNALYVNVAYADINENTIRVSSESALKCFHELEEDYGIYQANNEINIVGGAKTSKNQVMIDGVKYETDRYFDSSYIGCSVVYFYNEDDGRIVAMLPDSRVSFITMRSDMILDYTDNYYLVDNGGSKPQKLKLDNMADIILNNKLPLSYTDEMMIPDSGYVYLTDNNSDGKYDLVNIADYENFYVSGIYEEDGDSFIYDSITSKKVKVITDGDEPTVIVDSDNKTKTLGSIREKTLISIMGNVEDEVYTADKIVVSSHKVKGVYSKYSGQDRMVKITVNDTEYFVAPDFAETVRKLTIGREYTFSLDLTGAIASYDISFNSTNPMAVGYIIDAKPNYALEGGASLKMLTEYDKIIVYKTAPEIKLDSTTISGAYETVVDATVLGDGTKITPQLVCYNLNEDGKISKILRADSDVVAPFDIPSEFGLYKAFAKQSATYSGYQNSFWGKMPINDNTIIFSLPADPTDSSAEDEEYLRIEKSQIAGDTAYSAEAYYFDNTQLELNVVLLYGAKKTNEKITSRSTMAVISNITTELNDDGNTVNRIRMFGTSGEEAYLTDSSERISNAKFYGNATDLVAVEPGDVIRYALNSDNEICDIQVIYDYDEEDFYPSSSNAYNASERWVNGNVYRRAPGTVLLTNPGATIDDELTWDDMTSYALGSTVVIVENNGRGLEVEMGSKSDIRSFIEDGVAENIIYHSYQTAVRTIIVLR